MTDEERVLKAYRKLSKSRQKQISESWTEFIEWLTKVLANVAKIAYLAVRIWIIIQGSPGGDS